MTESFKIFINDTPLLFVEPGFALESDSWVELQMDAYSGVAQLIQDIYSREKGPHYFVRVDSTAKVLEDIRKSFTTVVAAGGLVWNSEGKLLMIFRRGKWDLPKGKLDPGEDLETAALREVEEETAVKGLHLKDKITVMYYVFKDHSKLFLKEIHWYSMSSNDDSPLIPQAKEEITKAEWATWSDIGENMKNTYHSIKDLLLSGMEKIKE